MTTINKPSSDWLARLILIVQESKAETGVEFIQFLDDMAIQHTENETNYELVQALKELR